MKIIVLGAGAWGTALAVSAVVQRPGAHTVTLWGRDAHQIQMLGMQRANQRYLPGVVLPAALQLSHAPLPDVCASLTPDDVVIIATPMAALRAMLVALARCPAPVAWLCKGFEAPLAGHAGLLGHEIQAAVAPQLRCGILSGPSFAQEVATGQPTALVAASPHGVLRAALVDAFHGNCLRIYANDDVIGVEVGGAVKNVLASATGLCDGLQLGLNARAALITRGLAEMTRLGLALGAKPETFMGLSGLGDLVLTATGDLSRNRRVGLAMAQGNSLEEAVRALGHVAEGVYSARTVLDRARSLDVAMPITESVVRLLEGGIRPKDAVAALMGRDPSNEGQ